MIIKPLMKLTDKANNSDTTWRNKNLASNAK